jgi:hypothetical protein
MSVCRYRRIVESKYQVDQNVANYPRLYSIMRQEATTTVPLDSMIMSMTTLADRKKSQHYSDIAEFIYPT